MWNRGNNRSGLTLVELLVVIGIVILVTAVALPIIKPALKDRKIREASRQLNSFISLARAAALEQGREAGIYLERSAINPNACFDVYLAESPYPYSGDTIEFSFANVQATNQVGGTQVRFDPFVNAQFQLAADGNPLAQLALGDEIKFDFKGPRYIIRGLYDADPNDNTNPIVVQVSHPEAKWSDVAGTPLDPLDDTLTYSPATPTPGSYRYQVFRQPTKSSVKAMTLPNNIAVDLNFSGLGLPVPDSSTALISGRQFRTSIAGDRRPVRIMFGPQGNLSKLTFIDPDNNTNQSFNPSGTVYLLVGRIEQIRDFDGIPAVPFSLNNSTDMIQLTRNIVDNSTQWITIGHRTGQVNTAPNGWPIAPEDLGPGTYFVDLMAAAREFAQAGESVGGQ